MNELERLAYLEVMGIQQWVAQSPLSHAKPSAFVDLDDLLDVSTQDFDPRGRADAVEVVNADGNAERLSAENAEPSNTAVAVNNEQVGEGQSQAPNEASNQASPQTPHQALHQDKPDLSSLIKPSGPSQNKPSTPAASELTKADDETVEIPQKAKQKAVTYTQVQYCQAGKYVVFADVENLKGQLSQAEHELLSNICLAIDNVLQIESRPHLRQVNYFNWPMFDSKFQADHIDQSETGAKQGASAFVNAALQKTTCPILILLGDNARQLVASPIAVSQKAEDQQIEVEPLNQICEQSVFDQEQVILSSSLVQLCGQPNLKSALWKNILTVLKNLPNT